jgi:hypothetical protein
MDWNYEIRTRESPDGRSLPYPLLVGDNGVEIHMDYSRHWFLDYRSADLVARFEMSRDFRGLSREETIAAAADEFALGPNCLVKMDIGRLSRPLESKDYATLAKNLKAALHMHLKFPGATPPKIERVRFADEGLQPFDD